MVTFNKKMASEHPYPVEILLTCSFNLRFIYLSSGIKIHKSPLKSMFYHYAYCTKFDYFRNLKKITENGIKTVNLEKNNGKNTSASAGVNHHRL